MVKKIITLLLSLCMILSLFTGVISAEEVTPYEITYDISAEDGSHEVLVPYGEYVTVVFTMYRTDSDDDYSLLSFQNEIEYDKDFFECDEDSWDIDEKFEYDGTGTPVIFDERTRGQAIVKVSATPELTDFNTQEQYICSFDLKVKAIEGESIISSSEEIATSRFIEDGEFVHAIIDTEDLIVRVDPDSVVRVTDVSVTPSSKTLEIGETQNLDVRVSPSNATLKDVTYSTSDSSVATVSEDGVVTAVQTGTATITVTTVDGGLTDTFVVTVVSEDDGPSVPSGGGKTYAIAFETNGGSAIASKRYEKDTVVDLSNIVPVREGYSFGGWYLDKALTQKVSSIKVTEGITLYARWIEGDVVEPGYVPEILTEEHVAYIVGRGDNKVQPQANITRAEVATIFFRLLNDDIRDANYSKENSFQDVNSGDWFNTAVSTLVKLGIIAGRSDKEFAPNDFITRAEYATISARLAKASGSLDVTFKDIDGHWGYEYIKKAASLGWIIGDNGLFRPDDFITRAEAMTLTNRILGRQPEAVSDILSDEMVKFDDNADVNAWYYLAIQEATNSHNSEKKDNGINEKWTSLTEDPDWSKLEK